VITLLTESDIDKLGLSLGQTKLFQRAVANYKVSVGSPVDGVTVGLAQLGIHGPKVDSNIQTGPQGVMSQGSFGGASGVAGSSGVPVPQVHPIFMPEIYLGLNTQGEETDFLDIPKFAAQIINPKDREEQTVCTTDGGELVFKTKGGPKKLALESVSPTLWLGANAKIMYSLLAKEELQVCEIPQYLAYTVQISHYAQTKDWISVLKYDNEYRRLQATYKFPWGSNIQHLSNFTLVEKPKGWPKTAQNQNGQFKGQKKGTDVCMLFNTGKCRFNPCKFKHCCSKCGFKDRKSVV
jgi:hypothetical protein